MTQHFNIQNEINPTTPGGDGSSNLTPTPNNDDDDIAEVNPSDYNTPPRAVWGSKEDDALVSAWLQCAVDDPVTATDQDYAKMWRNIKALYDESLSENQIEIRPRTLKALKGRWQRINRDVNVWVGAYAEAKRRRMSGNSEANIISTAQSLYGQSCNGNRFSLITIWEELRESDKWKAHQQRVPTKSGGSSKRSEPDTPTEEGPSSRPEGIKKAKRKAKTGNHSTVQSLDNFTQALSELNMRKEQSASVDKSRVDMIAQMMEYQRERDAQKMKMKQEKREEEKRFQLFSLLINKPSLDEKEHGILEELKKEFMHL